MRLPVSLLAFLVALNVESTAAGQIRGGDVMETGDLRANVKEKEIEIMIVEEAGEKSTKKKDSAKQDNGKKNKEVGDYDENVDDDDVQDDDGEVVYTSMEPDGFQLRDLFFPCQLLQAQFDLPISCRVDIFESLESDGSVGALVELNAPICTNTIFNLNACVSPIYSAYFGLSNFALSSRVDFTNISVGEFELGDIGIELEACGAGSGLSNTFCSCEASYDGNACSSCEICGFGNGNPINAVEIDCTNLVPFLSNFNSCQEIPALQTLKGGRIPVSVPNFIREMEFR